MKMYLPFGDWSDDGHGKWDKLLIDAPSMEHLLNAQKKIKAIYGDHFFDGMADQYEEPHFSEDVWQALKDSNYPIERMWETEDWNDWSDCNSIDEVLAADECPSLSIGFIMDVFIWLLNWQGAEITRLDSKDDIPMICNWTCSGFETVGYGCFW
jgi:hypothetical protein